MAAANTFTIKVNVQMKTRAAVAWATLMWRLRWLLGRERALRWANAGAARLVKYRWSRGTPRGPWRTFKRPDGKPWFRDPAAQVLVARATPDEHVSIPTPKQVRADEERGKDRP